MKVIGYVIAGICVFFGILFIWGAFGTTFDSGALIIGLIMVCIGIAILYVLNKNKQEKKEVTYKVDLAGDLNMKKMVCQHCGGALNPKDVQMVAGVPTVVCPYCGVSYQITEEPKW